MAELIPDLHVLPDRAGLARAAAGEVLRRARAAVAARGRFTLVLAGGSTPRDLYRLLAEERELPWASSHFFQGDERHVGPGHPESNFRMAREALFDRAPVPPGNVHRIAAEDPDAARAAAAYEAHLREFLALAPGEPPRFDLVLLGLGADGHTASLFPGSDALGETRRLVVAPWIEALRSFRITLTPKAIDHAAAVLFLVSGAEKAAALERALSSDEPPERCPARAIRPRDGELLWFADRAAAERIVVRSRTARPD